MMVGIKEKYSIAYKTNEKEFDLYRKKYEHDFKVAVVKEHFEGSKGLFLNQNNCLLVYAKSEVRFYKAVDYTLLPDHTLNIPIR